MSEELLITNGTYWRCQGCEVGFVVPANEKVMACPICMSSEVRHG